VGVGAGDGVGVGAGDGVGAGVGLGCGVGDGVELFEPLELELLPELLSLELFEGETLGVWLEAWLAAQDVANVNTTDRAMTIPNQAACFFMNLPSTSADYLILT